MEPQGRILDGDLETLGLQSTLKMLALGGKTGVLIVNSGQERLDIFLQGGAIVDLDEPGVRPPNLIEMFRLLGRLHRQQAIELHTLSRGDPNQVMMIMAQWGMMPADEIQQRVEFRVIQALSRAVRWERGRFEFLRDISAFQARSMMQKPLNVDHVLLEALRLADEWERDGATLSRAVVARWMPAFDGDVRQLSLTRDEIGVLCLANGQLPLSAVSFALMLPEATVAEIIGKLLSMGLIETVDAQMEVEMERSLIDLLTQCQSRLAQETRATPERRMLALVETMGFCLNGLFEHHKRFARALRSRRAVAPAEAAQYIEATFTPLLVAAQRESPRMEGIVRFEQGRLVFAEIAALERVVRGQELLDCYWDALRLFSTLMRSVFDRVLTDEIGQSRTGRQFEDLWTAFLREIDDEIEQHNRRFVVRAAAEHGARARQAQPVVQPGGQDRHASDSLAFGVAPGVQSGQRRAW